MKIETLIKLAEITIDADNGRLFYEDDYHFLQADSNFANGKTSIESFKTVPDEDDEFWQLTPEEEQLIWDAIEKGREVEREKQLDADEYQETLENLPRV